ncbi:hypothetical protein LTR37_012073 [Vermiconidia calcicola]|uniref:Uncharacterized protein n=1 Tax=Vermiconidia calcicola TaxID=1690605 RepID=A0ACC3N1K1_9PEZI|nr:hypothetical protein LTR37_012073 [Vermiconidia calcicola]
MVRKLDSFTEPVMDELRACFEDYWGSSTEWHEVNIWNSMLKFFARTSNRMWIKPVLGYLVIAPNWWHYRKAAKHLLPLIESRLDNIRRDPERDPSDILPNDFVT